MGKLYQNIFSFFGIVIVCFGIVSCAEANDTSIFELPPSVMKLDCEIVDGMVHVKTNSENAVLGTDDIWAKMSERPVMSVGFTYDFYMGRHEVICKDFNDVMEGANGLSIECNQDSLPAANVTYYDAVLYANALSKEKGFDTAYTYASAELDADRHCVRMKGFLFNPASNGFRLPTEAEWMLVANKNWEPYQSWNGENSGSVPHKVCSSLESKAFFCDLAGNMLELVNDRYVSFADTHIVNFVGAIEEDAVGSCVVKGGNYMSAPNSMMLYNRGDTYPIVGSTKGDYLGFRLARGAIPNATWLAENGHLVSAPIKPIMSAPEVRNLTNSYNVKLAFRNDVNGNLAYVDFSKTAKVVQIEDEIQVYHPDISPDGKRVAFCTTMEGSSKESSVYVRDLNESGSNLVKLPAENAAIPRWRVNPNGDTVIVYVTSAGGNKGESFMLESTWQVRFAGGAFGTPEKLFDGAYHGGVSLDNRFAVSASPLLRVRKAGSVNFDEIWYNGEQTCNASLSKDGTNRTIFLDFGGSQGRDFVGGKYGIHQMLLVADSVGTLQNAIASPAGYTFDHSEWAVGIYGEPSGKWAVASLVDANEAHRRIALVNVNDGSVVPLVDGEELWHPCLWVWQEGANNPAPLVNVDSAGNYFDVEANSPLAFASVELGMRLQSFWQRHDEIQAVALGSSTILNSVIENYIKSKPLVNMAVSMSDIYLHDYLIRNYVIPYAPHVKYIVVELSPSFMFRHYYDMTWALLYYSPGIQYDKVHLSLETKNEIARLSQEQQFSTVFLAQQYIENTFLLPSVGWGVAAVDTDADISAMTIDAPNLQVTLQMMKSLKAFADSNGVQLIAAIPPRNPGYAFNGVFDPHGPSSDVARQIINAVENMGILIFDENKYGYHDYTSEMAYNPNHLSYLGAIQFSIRLDDLLKSLP